MRLQPLSVFLVKNGQGGDRILFRYPYKVSTPKKATFFGNTTGNSGANQSNNSGEPVMYEVNSGNVGGGELDQEVNNSEDMLNLQQAAQAARHKFYKLPAEDILDEDVLEEKHASANLRAETLAEFPSKVLSNMFAVHAKLCDRKFELKINDVRFVGHPISLKVKPGEARNFARDIKSNITMFQVVFALKAVAEYSTVEIFHDLSQQIGVAIKYEERRCGYLTQEANILWQLQEEVANLPAEAQVDISPFAMALQGGPKSQLARSLKIIFEDISHNGYCYERIHNYIEISFCMPQKVYKRLNPCLDVEPESIWNCLEALRPYHGILLLYEERELLDKLPLDASPTLKKMLSHASPTNSFRTIASDSDLALLHVFHLAGHLLYWGLAIVIYPICETNIYVVSPKIKNLLNPVVVERFNDKFPGENLVSCLAMFSLPTSVAQRTAPILNAGHLQLLTKIIIWMLQQHLLVQLHTYVTLALNDEMKCNWEDPVEKMEQDTNKNKPPKVLERLDQESETDVTEDIDTILGAFNSTDDREEILKITTDKNELAKFAQVAVFMNGKYHIEEIMYHMDLRRAQLLQIIDKFRSIIVRHEHEDPALTMYYELIKR